ncbi:RagB/SusD family nutrient uptake outer membrane protein [uncultured Draconibacterium sp.]|uniref:RagB/SusD family nutrient uptake outer membrane protein n=1 Tax=uncultured Draconibacterium sp. TaxID=1573823 RepID=UPI0029C780EC|nr:RagB/SusD family nutrient uptake outer membrane protein [uncultured Draconibacterium sp.]
MKTMIYKFSKVFIVLVLLSFGCSEDFLEYEQRGVQTEESFYQTDDQVFEALMAVFDEWQGGVGFNYVFMLNGLSDESYAGGGARGDNGGILEEINEYRFSPTTAAISGFYGWMYNCVNRANLVINNTETDTEKKAMFVAMAKALRGYAYFYLSNLWGEVPLVLTQLNPDEYNQPRTPMAEINAQIEADFTEAIAALPVRSAMPATYQQLLSKGSVQAMLGKHYLFIDDFDKAASTFEQVINSGEYDLYPDYAKVLRKDSEHGVESVFELNYTSTLSYASIFGAESGIGGWVVMNGPRPEYLPAATFFMLDLFPFSWGFINPHKEMYDAYVEAGDNVRLTASILGPDELSALGAAYQTPAGFVPYGSDGYLDMKYLGYLSEGGGADGWTQFSNVGTNVRMIRYADVLLMAAEANNRKSSADDEKAKTYVNMVRSRVSLDPVTSAGTALFEDIKTERKLELSFEMVRYMDLQRWGDAYDALKDQGKKVPNGSGGYYEPQGAGYEQGKNELLPFPEYEMTVNTALEGAQNPGY